jgi:hypothetical protein
LERDEPAALHCVEEDGVPAAEGAALHVFAGQPDRDPVGENRRERQFLGGGPINRAFGRVVEQRLPSLAAAFELLVKREAGRCRSQCGVDLPKAFDRDTGDRSGCRAGWRQFRHLWHVILLGLERRERLLEDREVFLHQTFGNLARHRSLRGELPGKQLANGLVRVDGLVH